jgi:mono/diheme cytochrome c family protein
MGRGPSAPGRLALLAALAALAAGCERQKQQTAIEYMPDMAYSARVNPQHEDPLRPDESVMRVPVPGTVPRGYTPYRFAQADTTQAALENINPLPRTAQVLARGEKVFMTFCVVCHGPTGDGLGYQVPKFPQPPPLFSQKVMDWPDGRIFHVITRGQNIMPSYAAQILPEDRWAVIHFVRVLQRAAHPTAADLAARSGSSSSPGATAPAAEPAPPTPAAPPTAAAPPAGGGK